MTDMLNIKEVCEFFGGKGRPLDKSTIYRWIREGRLAAPIRLAPQTTRWRLSDCQKLMDEMIAGEQ